MFKNKTSDKGGSSSKVDKGKSDSTGNNEASSSKIRCEDSDANVAFVDSSSNIKEGESNSNVNSTTANPFEDFNAISACSTKNNDQPGSDIQIAEKEQPSIDARGFV
jgi:hypothetical protein